MRTLQPRIDILPPAQQQLWSQLAPARDLGFVLYGGTAIALRLGHRISVDFDFFSDRPLDKDRMRSRLAFLKSALTLQETANALTVLAVTEPYCGEVKVSFFGTLTFGRVGVPEMTEDQVLCIASSDDLLATKLKVVLQRNEAKDYKDIAALLLSGVSLAKGLAAARKMYGPSFQPSESLKALVYFEGGDLDTLTQEEHEVLIRAVGEVRELPEIQTVFPTLT